MQQRFLGLTAALAALGMTVALTGCGSSSGSSDVTLKLVAADYDVDGGQSSKKYWSDLAAAFTAKNPGIKIDVQIESWNDVDRKVAEMVKAGKAPTSRRSVRTPTTPRPTSSTPPTSCSPSPCSPTSSAPSSTRAR